MTHEQPLLPHRAPSDECRFVPVDPCVYRGAVVAIEPDPAYQWQDTAQTVPADDNGEPCGAVAKYGTGFARRSER